jgi:uncharacterized membrane protein
MSKGRLEAFSDGVIAILITIMVLELKVPHRADPGALRELVPVFLAYVLSFAYLGIYWTNHHHLLQLTRRVSGRVLWANLHLLFWLSLVPFVTGWMGENGNAPFPTASYGAVLVLSGVAYLILQRSIIATEGADSQIAAAVGRDLKGKLSSVLYAAAIPLSFAHVFFADAIYVGVAAMWLVPDRRLERRIQHEAA